MRLSLVSLLVVAPLLAAARSNVRADDAEKHRGADNEGSHRRPADREKYSRFLRASLEGQMDVLHGELSKVLSFDKHEVKLDQETKLPVLKEDRDMSPLAAGTPEDRLLRELKETHRLVDPKNAPKHEAYPLGGRRPEGEPYKVAPRSLDPDYDQKVEAALAFGMKPAEAPTSLYHGRLSNTPHYSSGDPASLLAGREASEAAAALAAKRKAHLAAKGKKDPSAHGPLPADPAAEQLALATSGSAATPGGDATATVAAASSSSAAGALAASLSADQDSASSAYGVVPLYQFRSDEMRDHFLTTETSLAATDGVDQWKGRTEVCRVYRDAAPATVPLYLFWDRSTLDHRYSTKASAPAGYVNDGVIAHVYATQVPGSVPLHEFYDANAHDHLYAVDDRELVKRQARGEVLSLGVACYVLPTRSAAATMSPASLLSQISKLTEATDVLAQAPGGWPIGSGTDDDGSMMGKLVDDPENDNDSATSTLVEEADKAGKGKGKGKAQVNEANESRGPRTVEPEITPEDSESSRRSAGRDDAPEPMSPPPNALIVDETADGARVPRVRPVYEYWNPQIRDHFYTTKYDVLADGKVDWKLVGPRFWMFDSPEYNTVPLYRYWALGAGDHYYTLQKFESSDYKYSGIAGYVFTKETADNVPLYRYYSRDARDHLYTLKRQDARRKALGYVYEGIQCYVFDSAKDNLLPQDFESSPGVLANFNRFYNAETKHHFYTTSTRELTGDILANGWISEGVAGRIHIYPQTGLVPLRRYWNVRSLTHYYSTRWLKLTDGWTYDGVQGYVSTTLKKGTVPLFRFHNPGSDDDLYTTDREEIRSRADRDAWVFKGVTCYVYSVEDEAPANVYRYFNPTATDYFYTTDKSIFGNGKDGWVLQGPVFSAFREGVRNTVPVHTYYHATNFDHLYTTRYFPNRKDGWTYRGVAYYAYAEDTENGKSSKLYRFFNPETRTHYYTTDPAEAAETRPGIYTIAKQEGWFFYGVTAHVLPPQAESGLKDPEPVTQLYAKAKGLSAYSLNPKFKAKGFVSRGVAFNAWARRADGLRPVFRYRSKAGIYSFSTSKLSGSDAGSVGNYNGVAFWVSKKARASSVPLYRFRSKSGAESLSTDPKLNAGWKFAGIAGFVMPVKGSGVASNPVNVYSYYSNQRKEHFYTANWGLLRHGGKGWVLEGVPFRAYAYKGAGRVPVYDHYDGNSKEHTLSLKSKLSSDTRPARIAFYVNEKREEKEQVPLLEFANEAASDRIYTVSASIFKKGAGKGASLTYRGQGGWKQVPGSKLGFAFKPLAQMQSLPVPTGAKPVYEIPRRDGAPAYSFTRTSTSQRAVFHAFETKIGESIPLFEYSNADTRDTLYTTKWFKAKAPWSGGDVAMYVLPRATKGAAPLYRFNDVSEKRHVYTVDISGIKSAGPVSAGKKKAAAATRSASKGKGKAKAKGKGKGNGKSAASKKGKSKTLTLLEDSESESVVKGKTAAKKGGSSKNKSAAKKGDKSAKKGKSAGRSRSRSRSNDKGGKGGKGLSKATFWKLRGVKGKLRYEGIQAYVFLPPKPRLPVFELYNAKKGIHMYTTSAQSARGDWRNMGAKFFAYTTKYAGTVPMREFVNQKTGERELMAKGKGAKGTIQSPSIPFYVFTNGGRGLVPLHSYSGKKDNVYITNQRLMVPGKVKGAWKFLDTDTDGWKYNGVVGFVMSGPSSFRG